MPANWAARTRCSRPPERQRQRRQPPKRGPAIGEQLSAGLSSVSAGASSLFDRAKQWLGETRDSAGEISEQRQHDAEEQQVRDALGRPVTRVILDPQDTIILNIGEIITNKAVAAARSGRDSGHAARQRQPRNA